jgi:hypothetical protein
MEADMTILKSASGRMLIVGVAVFLGSEAQTYIAERFE